MRQILVDVRKHGRNWRVHVDIPIHWRREQVVTGACLGQRIPRSKLPHGRLLPTKIQHNSQHLAANKDNHQ